MIFNELHKVRTGTFAEKDTHQYGVRIRLGIFFARHFSSHPCILDKEFLLIDLSYSS